MGHHRANNHLCIWVLTHHLHDLWILHSGHMNCDMGLMILVNKLAIGIAKNFPYGKYRISR
jgi:hypothetical protein